MKLARSGSRTAGFPCVHPSWRRPSAIGQVSRRAVCDRTSHLQMFMSIGETTRIVMHFHGLERDCTQTTRRAVSVNGIEFRDPRPTVADYYARVFEWRGTTYAMARAGSMHRSVDGGQTFPEKTRLGETNIRHVAVFAHQGELYSVYSRIGDAPERLVISRVSTEGDWRQWRLDDTRELLRAGPEWEGGHLPVEPSAMGPADQPMNQLRDPFVLVDRGQPWLFYACAGESGLGLALMTPDEFCPELRLNSTDAR